MSSALALVATLISESEKLLSLAESEQWDTFSEIEQARQNNIKQLDLRNVSLPEQKNTELRSQMQVLIALNSQIEAIFREKRSEAAAELRKINQGSKAKKAYS
jgi:hypothetical protein